MTSVVWKYPLRLDDEVTFEMPEGACPLTVQVQDGIPTLWAVVDPDAAPTNRMFRIAGTGHPIGADVGAYVGTFQLAEGALVFHLFDGGEDGERD